MLLSENVRRLRVESGSFRLQKKGFGSLFGEKGGRRRGAATAAESRGWMRGFLGGRLPERVPLGHGSNVGAIGAFGELDGEVAVSVGFGGGFETEEDAEVPRLHLGTTNVAG